MKLKQKFAAVIATISLFSNSVFAQTQFVRINGQIDPSDRGVAVLMLNKGADITDITNQDILWIDQCKVGEDGSFSITIPLMSEDKYDFYSNALSYEEAGTVKTVYVSSSGNNLNSGISQTSPLKTLGSAYEKYPDAEEIILLSDTTYENVPAGYEGNLTIKGSTENVKLTLTGEVSLTGNLTFDNLKVSGSQTIYANGYKLVMGSKITTDSRLTVYGGKKSADLTGDTNITLLGGKYQNIYGGGNGRKVSGNTNVVVGGTVNAGDGIDDTVSSISPCYVFGGGNNGTVTGKTNVTLQDQATAKYLVGAGYDTNGTAKDTNIFIKGGQVMNVYAGSTSTQLPSGTVTNITMTGGKAEALFGGCESVALTGHTFINVLGGEITRRVYTGCYNNLTNTLQWEGSNHVTGTTTLRIGPDASFNTQNGLAADTLNVGVFSGSRMSGRSNDEKNTVIFLDDCYSAKKGVLGEKTSKSTILGNIPMSTFLKSFENYTIKAGKNGDVFGTTTAGTVHIEPDKGYCGVIGTQKYDAGTVQVSDGANITFEKVNFKIEDVQANKESISETEANISAGVSFIANNTSNEAAPKMYAAIYDEIGKTLLSVTSVETSSDMNEHNFDFDYTFESKATYLVKVMMWNEEGKPLTSQYKFTVR